MKNFSKNFHQGYALIYTLLFIVLLLITVGTTWITGMADIRMQQRNEYSTEAYLLARSAVEDAWNRYKIEIGTGDALDKNLPTPPDSKIFCRVNPSELSDSCDEVTREEKYRLTLEETIGGRYELRYWWDADASKEMIEGIGYYRGSKITLKGEVTHPPSECIPVPITCDHSNDTIKIYQTGPS